jgi:hypothetical protein
MIVGIYRAFRSGRVFILKTVDPLGLLRLLVFLLTAG